MMAKKSIVKPWMNNKLLVLSFYPHRINSVFQIVLPPHLERIREKLAENSHELWAVTRIEQGWTFGPVGVFSAPHLFYKQCTIFIFCFAL